ncbi:MAG: Gfo/Idh/MocA family oxidoreductase [Gemmataceae bacterium]
MSTQDTNRRDFLKTGTAAAVTASLLATGVHAAGNDEIKVGIIGCGGRGSGAGHDVLQAAKNVTIHALGDAFEDRVNGARRGLESFAKSKEVTDLGNKVDVNGRVFTGLDAYKKVIDSGVNYVILATPPGFRPIHIEAAVNAGKNVFTEKPVGVDGPGIRKVLAAYEEAKKQKLGVAAGTQRRHQTGYLETIKRLHDGAIGDIVAGRCYWNQGILWKVPRKQGWTDLEAQMRNWYNYTWLCGDHIVEQHVHNIDVINWAIQAHPVKVVAMGFRTRTDPEFGHIYDFFSSDFEYPKQVHVISQCRQISNCANNISEAVQGTKGQCQVNAYTINGKRVLTRRGDNRPYVQEHTDLIESIRKGEPINELKNVAESTLSAIMARMSAYTGQEVSWDMALNSKESLMPEKLDPDMKLPTPPVAIPGKKPFA